MAEVIAAAKRGELAGPEARTVGVVIDVDEFDVPVSRPRLGPGGAVFERWHELREQGEPVTLVTSRTAEDPEDLAARGVTSLERV